MKINLVEDYNVYIDDDTGDEYISIDGQTLIRVRVGTKAIGKKGSEDVQQKEEEERLRQAAQEEGSVIETEQELQDRVKKIEAELENEENQNEISRETVDKVEREKLKKEYERSSAELRRFKNDPIIKFKDSLNTFIRKQITRANKETYSRLNRRYDGTDFIKKGKKKYDKPDIPTIRVYFDRSASWDESKTAIGRQALATLDKFVRAKQIKVNIHYFNDEVFDYYTENGTNGTAGTPILVNIEATKPDNVIVMTDSDISDCQQNVTVPGVVWFLFSGGVSYNLMDHLKGRIATKAFELN